MPADVFPRLRAIDPRPVTHRGRPSMHLRDVLRLSEHELVVPQPLASALAYLDGARDAEHIAAILERRHGLSLAIGDVQSLIDALDEACLLENDRSATAEARALAAYRAAPSREPACAGSSYPGTPAALKRRLNAYLAGAASDGALGSNLRAVFSPHIDYGRGGRVYAQAWRAARAAAVAADLAIIIGTDHYGDDPFTLTRQHYATPYGVLPTEQGAVNGLAEAAGGDAAFAGELRHKVEHSLELPLVWLHHVRDGAPIAIVPILVGSFSRFMRSGTSPAEDPSLGAVLDALARLTRGRRALVIASGDLAHVGPAFGGRPLSPSMKARLRQEDEALLQHIQDGSAEGFYGSIAAIRNRNNVCGTSPFYVALKHLGSAQGHLRGYEVCPADDAETSVVTVAGIALE